MEKQFFVGIGAQKAGTSWLAAYLGQHPEVAFSPLKELHYFDAMYRQDMCGHFNWRFKTQLRNAAGALTERYKHLMYRVEMTSDPQKYRDYFDFLTEENHKAFGEITPSYSLLAVDGFQAIRDMYENAKFIFILRNPWERYWSSLRFYETNGPDQDFSALDNVISGMDEPRFFLRTDYKRTIEELLKVVPGEDVLIIFFEHLFSPDKIDDEAKKITSFLGIDFMKPNLAKKVNVGKAMNLAIEDRKTIVSRFIDTYTYIANRYPEQVPESWLEDMRLIEDEL